MEFEINKTEEKIVKETGKKPVTYWRATGENGSGDKVTITEEGTSSFKDGDIVEVKNTGKQAKLPKKEE